VTIGGKSALELASGNRAGMHQMQIHGLRGNPPVNCFYEGEYMLVISPIECIDYGLCEPDCPATAIISTTRGDYGQWQ
jgi:hypothetical protein